MKREIEAFAKAHPVGNLAMPKDLDEFPTLAATVGFKAPGTIDLRDYCTPTEDQGSAPECAAFSTTSFAENILFRINDIPQQLDPHPVYKKAKELDGNNDPGTSLTHAVEALLSVYPNLFDKSCECKTIRSYFGGVNDIKYAIHKYGCMIGGFNITDEWYNAYGNKGWIPKGGNSIGGHAVLCCGYNPNGLIIQNSWSEAWGMYGFAVLPWDEVRKQFMYGAVIKGCLRKLD